MTSIGTGVEYALKAVDNSGTAVGIKCKDGVVLGVEKLVVSKMLVEGTNRRIMTVDRSAGIAIAGLVADGRALGNRAREEASQYKNFYQEPIPGKVLCERVAGYAHMYTLYWSVRPFGSSLLLATYDKDGPQLYGIEPSGISYRYFATAIGKGKQQAKTELEKLKLNEITCREAVKEIAKIIYKVHDEVKDKAFELEVSWVCEESGRQHQLVPKELKEEAERAAKQMLADMED